MNPPTKRAPVILDVDEDAAAEWVNEAEDLTVDDSTIEEEIITPPAQTVCSPFFRANILCR